MQRVHSEVKLRWLLYLPVFNALELPLKIDASHGLVDGVNLSNEETLNLLDEASPFVIVRAIQEVGRVRKLSLLEVVLRLAHVARLVHRRARLADLAASDYILEDFGHDLDEALDVGYRHVKLHLLLMVLKLQLLVLSSFLLTFLIDDLETLDDVLKAAHLISRCHLDLSIFLC